MEEKYQSTEHGIELKELHEFIRQHGETVSYDKGERLECEGEPARWWAFVERGQFKYVEHDDDGREHNTWFSLKGEFVGAYPDMMEGRPSQATTSYTTTCPPPNRVPSRISSTSTPSPPISSSTATARCLT